MFECIAIAVRFVPVVVAVLRENLSETIFAIDEKRNTSEPAVLVEVV
jgi:hypothetical protein